MKFAFDTNIFQIWRNINDPAIKKIAQHPTIQTIKRCFSEVDEGTPLIIPRIILTEHLIWVAKHEGTAAASEVLTKVLGSTWQVVYETEEVHRDAMIIGSRHGGLGAADLLLAAIAKRENATVVTIDSDFKSLIDEIEIILLESIAELI